MGTKFTREQIEQRIDALYAFAREQGFSITALGRGNSGRHHYLVLNGENFLEVSLTPTGGFWLSTEQGMGSRGRIGPRLMAWFEREGLPYELDHRFSRRACEYLAGAVDKFSTHAPQVKRRNMREERLVEGSGPLIRQLIPAQPGWFAVYTAVAHPGEGEDSFEMIPVVGWALVDDESPNGPADAIDDAPGVVALVMWDSADIGSQPAANPHFVLQDYTGFLGFAYPGCTIDWKERAANYWEAEEAGE